MKLVLEGVKAHLIRRELDFNNHLWDEWPLRTMSENSPHRDCHDIWLRFRDIFDLSALTPEEFCNSAYKPRWYPATQRLRHTKKIIERIFTLVGGDELGACLLTKVPPGKEVAWHKDDNWNANHFLNKYLLVVDNAPGAYFETCGEQHEGKPGDLFLFDNRLPHRVVNRSAQDRISLIISVKIKEPEAKAA